MAEALLTSMAIGSGLAITIATLEGKPIKEIELWASTGRRPAFWSACFGKFAAPALPGADAMLAMQTMNSVSPEPPSVAIRVLLLVLSIGSMIGVALTLAGVRFGFFYVPLLVATFLLLHKRSSEEQSRIKKEAPGRIGRPGA